MSKPFVASFRDFIFQRVKLDQRVKLEGELVVGKSRTSAHISGKREVCVKKALHIAYHLIRVDRGRKYHSAYPHIRVDRGKEDRAESG